VVLQSSSSDDSYETAVAKLNVSTYQVCFKLDSSLEQKEALAEGEGRAPLLSRRYDQGSSCTSLETFQQHEIVLQDLLPGVRSVDVDLFEESQLDQCREIGGDHCIAQQQEPHTSEGAVRTVGATSVFTVR
jgi:hypothetical protein